MISYALWENIRRMLKCKESLNQKYSVLAEDVCAPGIPPHTHFTVIPMGKPVLDLQNLQEHFLHMTCKCLVKAEPRNSQWSNPLFIDKIHKVIAIKI